MTRRMILALLGCLFLAMGTALPAPAQTEPQKSEVKAAPAAATEIDINDLVGECQKPVRGKDYAGIVWWVPVEFWEASAQSQGTNPAEAAEKFKPLRPYTLVAVAVGKIGGLGITWTPTQDVRKNVALRAGGVDYLPIETDKVNAEAQLLATILRPLLANIIGPIGQNMEFMFFPATNKDGGLLADARNKGEFTVVLKGLAGEPESAYEWRLPLTSLSPPKLSGGPGTHAGQLEILPLARREAGLARQHSAGRGRGPSASLRVNKPRHCKAASLRLRFPRLRSGQAGQGIRRAPH